MLDKVENMTKALEDFSNAYRRIIELWQDVNLDNIPTDVAPYPFESSFDELGIDDWCREKIDGLQHIKVSLTAEEFMLILEVFQIVVDMASVDTPDDTTMLTAMQNLLRNAKQVKGDPIYYLDINRYLAIVTYNTLDLYREFLKGLDGKQAEVDKHTQLMNKFNVG